MEDKIVKMLEHFEEDVPVSNGHFENYGKA
jgi:hypothetical protein